MIPDLNRLKKNLKKEVLFKHKIKLAVLGDSATQLLCMAIKGYGIEHAIDIEIYEAPYDQVDLQLNNPSSELYGFKPEYVIIFESFKKLQKRFYNTASEDRKNFAGQETEKVKGYYNVVTGRLNAKLIYLNYCETDDGIYGSLGTRYQSSYLFQVRYLNHSIALLASENKNFFIADLLSLQNQSGLSFITNQSIYMQAEMALSLDCLPYVAKNITDIIRTNLGLVKKCLIIDLDNTIWGGVIGDDGINNIEIGQLGIGKAFTEVQQWIKELKNRGIIICVASKNEEAIAREPFESHPEMILRMEDIAVFMANWDNKVKNIQKIQEILNIGYDSMVFIDDNPFERNMVREYLPEVTVPELPEDPSMYLDHLIKLNLFETNSVSENDTVRTKQYQQEAKRAEGLQYFENEGEYLKSLGMVSKVESITEHNLPRVAQLTLRSNQFNLRTKRYDEVSLKKFTQDKDNFVWNFSLNDKFGDHGLIATLMVRNDNSSLFIENWIMSCRVLKRGMENFTLNYLSGFAASLGCKSISGEYLPTAKNDIVREHYRSLGFTADGNRWILNLPGKELETHISEL